MTPAREPAPLLEMRGISQQFPGVRALDGVDLRLFPGEVHALMGQNGAGKSTLIKILSGVLPPQAGQILLHGKPVAPASPQQAQALGISAVFQEENLCPNLSVAENLFIGRFPQRRSLLGRCVDWHAVHARADAALAELLHLQLDVRRPLADFPLAIRQMVAIARAILADARVLVLDEATASLHEEEVAQLFATLHRLKARGVAILFITHFLEQVHQIAERITVLRNGQRVGEYPSAELSRIDLVRKMMGEEFQLSPSPARPAPPPGAAPLLETFQLGRSGSIRAFDLAIRPGEVLGLAGLLGSGRSEIARLLFGLDEADTGALRIAGRDLPHHSPGQAVRLGLAMIPEDRARQGIVAGLSLRENIVLALQARQGITHYLPPARQRAIATHFIQALGIKAVDAEMPIEQLSGGNQQKALLARWLAAHPQLLILDEPTRGIDVGAKQEILTQIQALSENGMAILFISSELDEVLRSSHRILVLRDRAVVATLAASETDPDQLMHVIAGGQA